MFTTEINIKTGYMQYFDLGFLGITLIFFTFLVLSSKAKDAQIEAQKEGLRFHKENNELLKNISKNQKELQENDQNIIQLLKSKV